ncbi:MAG: hypothetical protein M1831_003493 [Alyxoria varia]|nr:MAG: hypothetical protein M1831_003493 [Alyxoria varia]
MAPKIDLENKEVTVSLKEYLDTQNWLANSLLVTHGIASKTQLASFKLVETSNEVMRILQSNTRYTLHKNSLDESVIPAGEAFKSINTILHHMHANGDLKSTEALGEMALTNFGDSFRQPPAVQKKKVKKPRDPNAPKKPLTAFFLYLQDKKEEMANLWPHASPGERQSKMQENWKNAPKEVQEHYKTVYKGNWERYAQELANYKAQGGAVDPELENAHLPEVDVIAAVNGSDAEGDEESESESSSESSSEEEVPQQKAKTAKMEPSKTGKSKSKKGANAGPAIPAPAPPAPEETGKKKKRKHAGGETEAKKKKRQSQGFGGDDY